MEKELIREDMENYSQDMFYHNPNDEVILITCGDCNHSFEPSDHDFCDCEDCGSSNTMAETNMEGAICIFCGANAGPFDPVYVLEDDSRQSFMSSCCEQCFNKLI